MSFDMGDENGTFSACIVHETRGQLSFSACAGKWGASGTIANYAVEGGRISRSVSYSPA